MDQSVLFRGTYPYPLAYICVYIYIYIWTSFLLYSFYKKVENRFFLLKIITSTSSMIYGCYIDSSPVPKVIMTSLSKCVIHNLLIKQYNDTFSLHITYIYIKQMQIKIKQYIYIYIPNLFLKILFFYYVILWYFCPQQILTN